MAVVKLECPECGTVLKPTKPLPAGKKVTCPKCGNRFSAPGADEDDLPVARKSGKSEGIKAELVDDEDDLPVAKTKSKPPAKAAPPPPPAAKSKSVDDDEELGGTYGVIKEEEEEEEDDGRGRGRKKKKKKPEIDYAPDLTVKDPRGPAVAALAFPSNIMIAGAAFNFLLSLLTLLVFWWPVFFTKYGSFFTPGEIRLEYERLNPPQGQQPKKTAEDDDKPVPEVKLDDLKPEEMAIWDEKQDVEWTARIFVTAIGLTALVFWALTAYGGVQMQNLESRGWAMASAILVIVGIGYTAVGTLFGMAVPCLSCFIGPAGGLLCVFQLISGIYSIVKLNDEKIKAAFVYKPD